MSVFTYLGDADGCGGDFILSVRCRVLLIMFFGATDIAFDIEEVMYVRHCLRRAHHSIRMSLHGNTYLTSISGIDSKHDGSHQSRSDINLTNMRERERSIPKRCGIDVSQCDVRVWFRQLLSAHVQQRPLPCGRTSGRVLEVEYQCSYHLCGAH